jgi:hypothetical protein
MTEKKMEGSSGTQLTRFNALRHGILSQFSVLPWEDREEYETVHAELVAEHTPQGPTAEHLVEELAHIFWRKRRLRLAEAAAHRRSLGKVLSLTNFENTPEGAVISGPPFRTKWIKKAISATDQRSAEELVELKQERESAKIALAVLQTSGADAYDQAVEALGPHARQEWQDRITYDDFEDEKVFNANADNLLRFLTGHLLPGHDEREIRIKDRPLVQAQAFGESFDPDRLEVLARYEVHLDRKLERTLRMLLSLKGLRRPVDRD